MGEATGSSWQSAMSEQQQTNNKEAVNCDYNWKNETNNNARASIESLLV